MLTATVKATVIGDGFDDSVTGGPLVCAVHALWTNLTPYLQVSKAQFERVWGYIEAGKQEGARVALGGEKRSGKGYFVDPTSKSSLVSVAC